jgi:hypothetical protein
MQEQRCADVQCTLSQTSCSTTQQAVWVVCELHAAKCVGAVQVEVQGSGYAQSRVGYEAFRLHYYKTNALGWGRLVVELLFVILSAASFASDLSPVIFRRSSFVKQDQHWARYARPESPAAATAACFIVSLHGHHASALLIWRLQGLLPVHDIESSALRSSLLQRNF